MKDKQFFQKYMQSFLTQNSIVNLISKNDEKFLWEKHIYDSLSIELFFEKFNISLKNIDLLDIGTGGGFPAIPIALSYPDINVVALDSIRKKINAIENIKSELKIANLQTVCERAENISQKFDIVTSRAVASLKKITEYAIPLLKKDGYFVCYKSLKVLEEIEDAKLTLKNLKAEILDVIEYNLPTKENFIRNLVIIHKK